MNKYYKSFHFLFVCHSYITEDDIVIFTSNETDIIKAITVLSTSKATCTNDINSLVLKYTCNFSAQNKFLFLMF